MTRTSRFAAFLVAAFCGSTAFAITAPTQLSGVRLWLDANDVDGDNVVEGAGETYTTTWVDKSGNGFNFVSPGPSPTRVLGGLGGNAVLSFNGSNQYFAGPAVLSAGDDNYTYFAVFRPTDPGNIHSVYEQAGTLGSTRSALLQVGGAYGFNGESNDAHGIVPIKANLWRVADMQVDNSVSPNIQIIENGVTFTGTTGNPAALNIGTAGATVGRKQQVNSEYMAGQIAEIIVYDRTLTASEHNDVNAYLNSKWNVFGIDSLAHRWSFNDNTANDSVGTAHGALINGASVAGGQLSLNGVNQYVDTAPIDGDIAAKTLVAWITPANLSQQSGSVLTLENPTGSDVFDGIVYGERTAGQWMSGSEFWNRSPANNGGPTESSTGEIMMAIAYRPGGIIDLYRNGVLYASYTTGGPVNYPGGIADVLLGLRHIDAAGNVGTAGGNDAYWAGLINEARIYGGALSQADIQRLFALGPNVTGLEAAALPEPASLSLLALAAGSIAVGRRRRSR